MTVIGVATVLLKVSVELFSECNEELVATVPTEMRSTTLIHCKVAYRGGGGH